MWPRLSSWNGGSDAYAIMRDIKSCSIRTACSNPDVIITDNDQLHLENLKAMPAADPLVDRCIECGFCRAGLPVNGLEPDPRQRICTVAAHQPFAAQRRHYRAGQSSKCQYRYLGIDTCAATGMCATRCPVGINTGTLMKQQLGAPAAPGCGARWAASHMRLLTAGARLGLGVRASASKLLGKPAVQALNRGLHHALKPFPIIAAGRARPDPPPATPSATGRPVVYFISCVVAPWPKAATTPPA